MLNGSGLRAALGARREARAEVATLASREAAAGGDSPGADALGAGWGITKGLDPEMALLAEHLLKPLPADRQIETGPFLEAVAHLPPFFGESRAPPALSTCPDLSAPSLPSDEPHHSLSSIAPQHPLLLHHGHAAPTSGSPERLHPRFHFSSLSDWFSIFPHP